MPRAPRNHQSIEDLDQLSHAGRLDADRFDHGHAQFAGQPFGIDHNALAARDIAHVERDHHGQTQPLQAQYQTQVLAQIGRIGDADDEVRLSLSGASAEQYIGGDLFVRCQWIEAVGSRQVQYAHAQPGRGEQRALFALDGYAGVVGDLLPAAGENIEQCRLTAVGIANQGDEGTRSAGQSLHGTHAGCGCSGQTRIQAASKSRSANVPVPMRTAIGARAIRPRATMRTASPGRKPNSARRRPNSTGVAASDAATETTRARVPILSSVSRMSADAGAGMWVWG